MSCRSTNAPQTTTFLCYRSFINSSPLQLSKYTIPKTAISVKPKAGNRESATSAGNHHVLALDSNHNVWARGKNYYGQLGNGKSAINYQSGLEYESQPVQVMRGQSTPLTNIVYIDAGFEHSMAIDKQGNIWVWGRNEHSELGLGEYYYHLNQKYARQMHQ
jgi:alpha-tubulin suppressor-like RCC1 family protein